MLAAAIHLMRGTPYIYQGEELGMTNAGYRDISQYRDVESLNYYEILLSQGKSHEEALDILSARSRDNGRTPMQWTDGKNAGFSEVSPWIGLPENYNTINAESEAADKDSILSFYKALICLRKENPVIAEGEIKFLHQENPDVLAYKRTRGDEELLVLCNFRDREVAVEELSQEGYHKVLGNYKDCARSLRPYEAVVLGRGV